MIAALMHWWCGLFGGHEFVRTVNARGQWETCLHCGKESPGWQNAPPAYRQTQPGNPAKTALRAYPANVTQLVPRRRRGSAARG